jgi:LysR family transcriptional regulator, glycine cleavage system transcriptional activator
LQTTIANVLHAFRECDEIVIMPSRPPSLDLLRGFEAAARRSSFTLAAQELFVTQSAISRQVKALEADLGVRLFERRHRAIRLTPAGQTLLRATDQALRLLADVAADLRAGEARRPLTVTCSVGFASLWLVPRLLEFRDAQPEIDLRIDANNRLVDLERDGIELAVRYCPPELAPAGARRLFGEEVFPVCAPGVAANAGRPLATPQDLVHHVLLHFGDDDSVLPSASWTFWTEAMGLGRLAPAGSLRFSHYDQVIQAAVEGQGVALGIGPLVRRHLEQGRLVAPFEQRFATPRGYYLATSARGRGRADVRAFSDWLVEAAGRDAPQH